MPKGLRATTQEIVRLEIDPGIESIFLIPCRENRISRDCHLDDCSGYLVETGIGGHRGVQDQSTSAVLAVVVDLQPRVVGEDEVVFQPLDGGPKIKEMNVDK